MQSRQVRLFGVIGGIILIFFLVIFFGNDIKQLIYPSNIDNLSKVEESTNNKIKKALENESNSDNNLANNISKIKNPIAKKLDDEKESMIVSEVVKEEKIIQNTLLESPEVNKTILLQNVTRPITDEQVVVEKEVKTVGKIIPEVKKEDIFLLVKKEIKSYLKENPLYRQSVQYLSEDDKKTLEQIVLQLKKLQIPYLLKVEGHTEAKQLHNVSVVMGENVKRYLVSKLSAVQMEVNGYGNEYPILDDPTAIENRRIELIIRRK